MRIRCTIVSALVLAACGGDAPQAAESGAPAAGESSAPAAEPPPAPAPGERRAAAPAPSASQVPTAADSTAALAEDVSPEWKMRSRHGESFSSCMEKTVNAPPDLRPTLVEACHRLPDAPKR